MLLEERGYAELTPVPLPAQEPWVDDAAAFLADFVAHLQGQSPLPCPATDHVKSLRMVEACIQSSATGQTVDPRALRHERTMR